MQRVEIFTTIERLRDTLRWSPSLDREIIRSQ